MAGVSITNLTRHERVPRFAYGKVAATVLPGWDVSLVFVSTARARALNERLRRKTYVPNVLAYSVGEKNGEVFICLAQAQKQAADYEMTGRIFVLYLFIHGLLHLKGAAHGGTMERSEQKLLARFAKSRTRARTHVPTHHHRH